MAVRAYLVGEFEQIRERLARAVVTVSRADLRQGRRWVVTIIGGLLALAGVLIGLLASNPQPTSFPLVSSMNRGAVAPPQAHPQIAQPDARPARIASTDPDDGTRADQAVSEPRPVAKARTAERHAQPLGSVRGRGQPTRSPVGGGQEMAENLIGSFASGGFPGSGH
ncbi:hypothetical protein [Pseudonocardia spinosispora]|uniref:hypothetical protein n=1 Tax=Pseudonocardia spinosispora TaxID=103441 RepID=UPI00041B2809|nr:hypothetical protein [Pseudonocardia spinosispora]